ncbi:hypothetical protein, partial [Isoptericola sp. NPDC056134]|uniref:hypothetical protein n=1 Tax=Isoptericola sp. NPDC056134 TaxID=3345723 RepID=UPI0035E73E57
LKGWQWTFRGRTFAEFGGGTPTHFWTPSSGGYVAAGFYDSDGGVAETVPGWRISHRITRARMTYLSETDNYDGTERGYARVDAGWLPIPDRMPRGVCARCFMELTPSGDCVNCD